MFLLCFTVVKYLIMFLGLTFEFSSCMEDGAIGRFLHAAQHT